MLNRPIYLDFAATTPVDPRVADLVYHVMTEEFGNAGSRTHIWGVEAKKLVDKAREQVAAVVDASPDEVIFTSGATESNNLAILGLSEYALAEGKRHLISTQIEHKAVLEPLQEMERRGFEVTLLRPNSGGWIPPEEVAKALRPDTLLVSVMQVNNETGIIQPIPEICEVLKDHPAYLHMDAAQGYGKELEAPRLKRVDFISISGHKIYAPKGVGALISRRRRFKRPPLKPLMYGGGQEFGYRPGTHAVSLIAGLGLASELTLADHERNFEATKRHQEVITRFLAELGFTTVGSDAHRISSISAYHLPMTDSESLIMSLRDVVSISNGSACSSTDYSLSHVYTALGFKKEEAACITRWSFGPSELSFDPTKLESVLLRLR